MSSHRTASSLSARHAREIRTTRPRVDDTRVVTPLKRRTDKGRVEARWMRSI